MINAIMVQCALGAPGLSFCVPLQSNRLSFLNTYRLNHEDVGFLKLSEKLLSRAVVLMLADNRSTGVWSERGFLDAGPRVLI